MAGRNQHFQKVTIANATSLSAAVNLSQYRLCGIKIPAVWTVASLTFQAANADQNNAAEVFGNVKTSAGQEYAIPVVANDFINVNIYDFAGAQYLKLRSGTAANPVAQGQDSVITLIYRNTQ